MTRKVSDNHPVKTYFVGALHESFHNRLGLAETEEVEAYLTEMLIRFLHCDGIFAIRDSAGRQIESVMEMVAEGDVRQNADSFDREREVHRHVGDFLLFWSGLFPEFLRELKAPTRPDLVLDVTQQGKYSYHVVSTFEHDPYGDEAALFRKLSEEFEAFQMGLSFVRASFEGYKRQGWSDGFQA
jgi:hypothetical protein